MRPAIEPGHVYGRWTVVGEAAADSKGRRWFCRCQCGAERAVNATHLRSGASASCGCLQRERASEAKTTHGYTQRGIEPREYTIWKGMKRRCYARTCKAYPNYGGRGITVAPEWLHDFPRFLADMGLCPPGYSIDRYPNNDGNYEPGNCRWTTDSEQAKNTRLTRTLTIGGETMCVADWARRTGLTAATVYGRLSMGYSHEDAVADGSRARTFLGQNGKAPGRRAPSELGG